MHHKVAYKARTFCLPEYYFFISRFTVTSTLNFLTFPHQSVFKTSVISLFYKRIQATQ